MEIIFIKKTKDIRPNRSKKIQAGTRINCTNELAKKYIDLGVAEPTSIKVKKPIKTIEQAEKLN